MSCKSNNLKIRKKPTRHVLPSHFSPPQKDIPRIELDITGLTKQLEEIKSRLPKLKEACRLGKEDQNKLAKLDQEIEERQKALNKAKKAAESVVASIAKIEEQISNAGGAKLKKQREKVQQISSEIDAANETATKMEVAINSGKVAIKKLEKTIASDEKKLESHQKELESKKKEKDNLTEVAADGIPLTV